MFDELFLKADTRWAAHMARSRIEAIDASRKLQWLVHVANGDSALILAFDHAPSFPQIVQRACDMGLWGEVTVKAITVGRKTPRPLLRFGRFCQVVFSGRDNGGTCGQAASSQVMAFHKLKAPARAWR